MRSRLVLGSLLVITCIGCAQVRVRTLDSAGGKRAEGVRFYRPWPYLLVTVETGEKGSQFKNQVIYLPKTDEPFVAEVSPGWGTANGTVKLQDGWNLVELGAATDSKIPDTITAVSGLIPAVAGLIKFTGVDEAVAPGLYRFEFSEDGFVSRLVPVTLPMAKMQ